MNITKLILAAGFAVVSTGAFAETGVGTLQIDNVANVYGRAGVPNVKISGAVTSQPTDVAVPGGNIAGTGDTKIAVTSGKNVITFGRS